MPHLCIGTSAAILKKSHFMHGAVSRTVEKNLFSFSMVLPCTFVRWVKGDQVVITDRDLMTGRPVHYY